MPEVYVISPSYRKDTIVCPCGTKVRRDFVPPVENRTVKTGTKPDGTDHNETSRYRIWLCSGCASEHIQRVNA